MTTPHARHLAEMRATLPPQPVEVLTDVARHLRHLVPCATRRHLLEMRVFAVLADGEWHRHEDFERRAITTLAVMAVAGLVTRGPLGWRLAGGAA